LLALLKKNFADIKDGIIGYSLIAIILSVALLSILGSINILNYFHVITPNTFDINVAAGHWAVAIGITVLFAAIVFTLGFLSVTLLEFSWLSLRDARKHSSPSSSSPPNYVLRILFFALTVIVNFCLLAIGLFTLLILIIAIWPVYFDSEIRHAVASDDIYYISPTFMLVVSGIVFMLTIPLLIGVFVFAVFGLPAALLTLTQLLVGMLYRLIFHETRPESSNSSRPVNSNSASNVETKEDEAVTVAPGLSDMTAYLVNARSFGNIYAAGADIFADYTRSEESSAALAACVFWQIAMRSPEFQKAFVTLGIGPQRRDSIESFVIMRGQSDYGRYDLALLDPKRRREPRAFDTFPLSGTGLAEGIDRWLAEHGNTEIGSIVGAHGVQPWRSMRDNVPFGLIAMRRPNLQRNGGLPTPTPVILAGGRMLIASAGLLATDSRGRVGVTTARHAVVEAMGMSMTTSMIGVDLVIGEMQGEVIAEDIISDSVFVVLGDPSDGSWPTGHRGALQGVAPRQKEEVSFSGATTPAGAGVIQAMSPDIPFVRPLSQLKVLTNPVTSPGDSGTALLDRERKIMGFAFERTAPGEVNGYSSWIWADSVLQALELRLK